MSKMRVCDLSTKNSAKFCMVDKNGLPYLENGKLVVYEPAAPDAGIVEAYCFFNNYAEDKDIDFKEQSLIDLLEGGVKSEDAEVAYERGVSKFFGEKFLTKEDGSLVKSLEKLVDELDALVDQMARTEKRFDKFQDKMEEKMEEYGITELDEEYEEEYDEDEEYDEEYDEDLDEDYEEDEDLEESEDDVER